MCKDLESIRIVIGEFRDKTWQKVPSAHLIILTDCCRVHLGSWPYIDVKLKVDSQRNNLALRLNALNSF